MIKLESCLLFLLFILINYNNKLIASNYKLINRIFKHKVNLNYLEPIDPRTYNIGAVNLNDPP